MAEFKAENLGVWLIGVKGGLATTVIVGARALARELISPLGLVTELPPFNNLPLIPVKNMVFGGYDIQKGTVFQKAENIASNTGTFNRDLLHNLKEDLEEIDHDTLLGTCINCGSTIEQLADKSISIYKLSLKEQVHKIQEDLTNFQKKHNLKEVVVINVSSTEPPLTSLALYSSLAELDDLVERNCYKEVRAGTLYTCSLIKKGYPFINFTPSNSYFLPGIEELAHKMKVPYMGNDGKTGESLVKSTLAPMFSYRNLRVLSWQGYNILGDLDGQVLADERVKESKLKSKEQIVSKILGYPLHTKVGIDYVPSLDDWKTAWDFIHFQGFLNVKMSCQFIWQGCDSILAAPLVLDLVRFAHLAKKQGEYGPMKHLACYFKDPLSQDEHNFHKQYEGLVKYAQSYLESNPDR